MIGKGLAHVQHGMDRLTEWGFRKMREASSVSQKVKHADSKTARVAAAGRALLGFLGRAGEAYYKTYEMLKSRGK